MNKKKSEQKKTMSESRDGALRGLAGYNLKRAYMSIRADLLTVLEEFELRVATFSALVLITERPDMTQTQLAEALSIERSGVVVIVDELENRDLISRNKVDGDRRTYALRATLAGVRFKDKVMAKVKQHEDRMLGKLTRQQRSTLIELLNLIEDEKAPVSPGRSK